MRPTSRPPEAEPRTCRELCAAELACSRLSLVPDGKWHTVFGTSALMSNCSFLLLRILNAVFMLSILYLSLATYIVDSRDKRNSMVARGNSCIG